LRQGIDVSRDVTILRRFLFCALLALALFDQSKADPRYDVIPTPPWVVPADLPAHESLDFELNKGGANYLLVDHQIRLGAVESHYARVVTRLTNVSGIEDHSQITINFDPKIERLHLHYVLVRRGSVAIDNCTTVGCASFNAKAISRTNWLMANSRFIWSWRTCGWVTLSITATPWSDATPSGEIGALDGFQRNGVSRSNDRESGCCRRSVQH
jgi:hypothetical protein